MNNISAISLDQECFTSFLNLHVILVILNNIQETHHNNVSVIGTL